MITTSQRGINQDLLPYQLYQKAKRFGIWNPQDIDCVRMPSTSRR